MAPQSDGAGGYTADFSVGVRGGSGGSMSADSSVAAALGSVKALRTTAGTRKLRLTVTSSEAVSAVARLTRSGRTLVKARSRSLAAGKHSFSVTIPSTVRARRGDVARHVHRRGREHEDVHARGARGKALTRVTEGTDP